MPPDPPERIFIRPPDDVLSGDPEALDRFIDEWLAMFFPNGVVDDDEDASRLTDGIDNPTEPPVDPSAPES